MKQMLLPHIYQWPSHKIRSTWSVYLEAATHLHVGAFGLAQLGEDGVVKQQMDHERVAHKLMQRLPTRPLEHADQSVRVVAHHIVRVRHTMARGSRQDLSIAQCQQVARVAGAHLLM